MATGSNSGVLVGIFALGIILPALLCSFGVGKSPLGMKLRVFAIASYIEVCMLVDVHSSSNNFILPAAKFRNATLTRTPEYYSMPFGS